MGANSPPSGLTRRWATDRVDYSALGRVGARQESAAAKLGSGIAALGEGVSKLGGKIDVEMKKAEVAAKKKSGGGGGGRIGGRSNKGQGRMTKEEFHLSKENFKTWENDANLRATERRKNATPEELDSPEWNAAQEEINDAEAQEYWDTYIEQEGVSDGVKFFNDSALRARRRNNAADNKLYRDKYLAGKTDAELTNKYKGPVQDRLTNGEVPQDVFVGLAAEIDAAETYSGVGADLKKNEAALSVARGMLNGMPVNEAIAYAERPTGKARDGEPEFMKRVTAAERKALVAKLKDRSKHEEKEYQQGFIEGGKTHSRHQLIDPEQYDILEAQTEENPTPENVAKMAVIKAGQIHRRPDFNYLSFTDQLAAIDRDQEAASKKGPLTSEQAQFFQARRDMVGTDHKFAMSQPLEYAQLKGTINRNALDFSDASKLEASLIVRKKDASIASERNGTPLTFFKPYERQAIVDAFSSGDPTILNAINEVFGENSPKAFEQIAGKGGDSVAGAMAVLGYYTSAVPNSQGMMNKYAEGRKLLDEKGRKSLIDTTATARLERGAEINKALGGTFDEPAKIKAMMYAIEAMAETDMAGGKEPDIAAYALSLVGQDGEYGGLGSTREYSGVSEGWGNTFGSGSASMTIVPPNVRREDFKSVVEAIQIEDFGDAAPVGSHDIPLTAGDIQNSSLRNVGSGRYNVLDSSGEPARYPKGHKNAGEPFVLDFEDIEDKLQEPDRGLDEGTFR